MELTPREQAIALLRQSTTPLILLPTTPSTDALAAGLALLLVLEKQGKLVKIVSPDFTLPPGHDFLPRTGAVEQRLSSLRKFVIRVDTSKTKLDNLSYDMQDAAVHIYLEPKQGFFEAKDVTLSAGAFTHDLIITLDLATLEALGSLYTDNAEFFFQTPILNIDHHSENTRFGHTNLVDVVASSVSEILFEVIKDLGHELIDEQVATSALTGIISKTKAFQNQRVTPRSLSIASHLMSAGARREEIVQHLYQTKTLATLKLWGRALGRIKTEREGKIVWTTITTTDLEETGTTPADATGALDELLTEAANAGITCLFVQDGETTQAHVVAQPAPEEVLIKLGLRRRGPEYFTGTISGSVTKVATDIVTTLSNT
jgi:nanoRNase/pAp phosphatase (c-di-AMP/oligoRNAs hydrolase)